MSQIKIFVLPLKIDWVRSIMLESHLSIRIDAQKKANLKTIADSQNISVSMLIKKMIDMTLKSQ